ncbi:hypothetical protein GCM10011490_07080 [Pseudoclavibacter endophyticus]|nr:hypothetical protein GCM10011490_07080 [Pseudoclavibacter endophyticus]
MGSRLELAGKLGRLVFVVRLDDETRHDFVLQENGKGGHRGFLRDRAASVPLDASAPSRTEQGMNLYGSRRVVASEVRRGIGHAAPA